MRTILSQQYPAYLTFFDRVMKRTKGHRFNMMVMRRDYFDHYCEWMFDVLARAEEQIDWHAYSTYDQRVFGFLAERLMDVWVETNRVPYTEMPVVFLESQHWLKKGTAFLRRKFKGRP